MVQVVLKGLNYQGKEWIGIYFEFNSKINGAIQKTGVARWSKTNNCWCIPLSKENYNKLFFTLEGKAEIEQSALHEYLQKKKKAP